MFQGFLILLVTSIVVSQEPLSSECTSKINILNERLLQCQRSAEQRSYPCNDVPMDLMTAVEALLHNISDERAKDFETSSRLITLVSDHIKDLEGAIDRTGKV